VRDLAQGSARAAFVVAVELKKADVTPSFARAGPPPIATCVREAMRRKLVWVEELRFRGWGCSECAWVFNPSGSPTGQTLDEMKSHYERQRDTDFAAHVCAEHPRAKNTKS
jgi:hypothetical protein